MKRSIILYTIFIGFFACFIWWVIDSGKNLKPQSEQLISSEQVLNNAVEKSRPVIINSDDSIWEQFYQNIKSPLGILLLQIVIILVVSKLFGAIFTKINQPSVVGEMVAGIFLGPSIMGFIFPEFSEFLFPSISLNNLQFL